ncbi:MAG TPA: hypothetical protein VGG75_38155 [Trebonia sp.]|jgi:hypothetical protein
MATKEIELRVTVVVSEETDLQIVPTRVWLALDDAFTFGVKTVELADAE